LAAEQTPYSKEKANTAYLKAHIKVVYLLSIKYFCSDAKDHILGHRYCFSEFDCSLLQIPIGEDYR
jgi:hypothetical protein